MIYREVSHDFEVSVRPEYVPEQSVPEQNYFFFAYHVTIRNRGKLDAQLLDRNWIITDGRGAVEEVVGRGVIGEQPTIKSGEIYSYSSFCPLSTDTGNMRGSYTMRTSDGAEKVIQVPLFFLRHPRTFQ